MTQDDPPRPGSGSRRGRRVGQRRRRPSGELPRRAEADGRRRLVSVVGAPPPGVRATSLGRLLEGVLSAVGSPLAPVSVRFVGDRASRRFNRAYRGIDRPTDILSFPAGEGLAGCPYLGDILISRDRVRVQARGMGLTCEREVAELLIHGVLHLLGYDHQRDDGEMDALELRLRQQLLDGARPSSGGRRR